MRFATVCSGIEACSAAWQPLGWEAQFFAEIAPFQSALLKHYYPETPNLGDFIEADYTRYIGTVDVLCGGTPCQDFSIAGKRDGLDGARGNLALDFFALGARLRCPWIVWENVPGILSSGGGRDFRRIIAKAIECGYGLVWRILDSKHFGIPQQRRRVFLVGHTGGWTRPAAVLFESEMLRRDIKKGRATGEEVTGTLGGGSGERGRRDDLDTTAYTVTHSLTAAGHDASEDGTGRGSPIVFQPRVGRNGRGAPSEIVSGLNAQAGMTGKGDAAPCVVIPCLNPGAHPGGFNGQDVNQIVVGERPRRLTPLEWERCFGFPDHYTAIPYKGKPASDSARYQALGNSMAVPVIRWLGERIELVEAIA